MFKKYSLLTALLFYSSVIFGGSVIHHKITVTIDPSKHSIEAVDQITIPPDQVKPTIFFLLNKDLEVSCETPGVVLKLDKSEVKAEDFGMDRENFGQSGNVKINKYTVTFTDAAKGDAVFMLKFSGEINYPIEQMGEEYARGFSTTPGIIDEKGIYLAGSTYWVPWFNDDWITFELTTTVPDPWDIVSEGKRTLNEVKDGRHTIRWDSPEPMEEIHLIGAKFTEYSKPAGAIDVMAFLRTPDETLANKYLEVTAQYLEMLNLSSGLQQP